MIHQRVPRFVLAGTRSGCGKTTVTCALLQAFVGRGLKAASFKCGPDYIDPMFHSRIIGARSSNLDSFFFSANTVRALLCRHASGCDVSVLEGVMGFYDGPGLTDLTASTYEMAQLTRSPVVLVVDAKGASLSVLAEIHGFLHLCPQSPIRGVILNNCSPAAYQPLARAMAERYGGQISPLGFLPRMPDCALESRHLGLVTPKEIAGLQEKTRRLAAQAERTIAVDRLLELSEQAPPVAYEPISRPPLHDPVRIAVARDSAFCFYYEDSLDVLRELGAELIPFSPLSDSGLPEQIQGLYLGGGYPEPYAPQLSENRPMRDSIRRALRQNLPCIAECGGFMYLTRAIGEHPMVGFLEGTCRDTGVLTRFGYVTLKARRPCLLCGRNGSIRGHEFHHWDCDAAGSDFEAAKASGKSWPCVVANEHLYAGYPHFHFLSNPQFAENFYLACLKEKHRHDPTYQPLGDRTAQL